MSALSGFIVRFLGCMCSSRTHGVGCLSPKKVASFTERAGFDVGVCLLRKSVALALRGAARGGSGGVRRAAPAGRGVGRRPGLAWQAAALHVLAPDACARPFRSRSGQEQRAMVESVVARSSLAGGAVTFPLQGVGFCVSCTLLLRASRPAPVACKFQVVCLATPGLRVLPSRPVQQLAISARPFARISPTPSARAAPACSEPVPRQL